MQEYAALRKQKKNMLFPVVALALCVILSASMLFSRLVGFTAEDASLMIPLTESNGVTKVQAVSQLSAPQPRPMALCAGGAVVKLDNETTAPTQQPTNPGFRVEDANTVWEGKTDVEIFRVSYENGEGQITVQSGKGDKVIAPGTENEYTFSLHNTGDVGLNYTLEMEAYFSDGIEKIPVQARVIDYQGNYLLGSENSYADVLKLNGVSVKNGISAGYLAPYTLQWLWPFDGDDELDTMLGNLAVDQDITLTIVIRTTAEQGGEGGKPPQTGDGGVVIAAVAMACSMIGLVVLLLPKRRRESANG